MSKGSILQVNNVYLLNSYTIPSDPALSDIFRLSDLTVGNRRIRQLPVGIRSQGIRQHPTESYRKLSDSCRKLSDCVGFPVGSDGIRQSVSSSWVPSLPILFDPRSNIVSVYIEWWWWTCNGWIEKFSYCVCLQCIS